MTVTHELERVEGAGRPDPVGSTAGGKVRRVRHPGRWWALGSSVAIVASMVVTGVGSGDAVNTDGLPQLLEFFAGAVSPQLERGFLLITWESALVTVGYAVLGSLLSLVIGMVLGLLTCEAWLLAGDSSPLATGAQRVLRALLIPIRSVHEAVYAIVLVNILGLNPLVAVLSIGIPFGAVTAKVFANFFDDVGTAPAQLMRASGASRSGIILHALLPSASRNLATYGFYRFECAIRAAAVLGVIGAGGIGFQIRLSFQSLRYDEMWTLIYALVILCGLADWWSSAVRRSDGTSRTGGVRTRPVILASLIAGAVGVVASWWYLGIELSTLWAQRAIDNARRFITESLPPETPEGLRPLFDAAVQTLAMSILASALAFGLAAIVAPIAARRRGHRVRVAGRVRVGVTRLLLLVCRAVPPPVWALVLLFVFFPGVLPGALALAVYNFGVLGRLLAELVENQGDRSAGVLRATGATPAQVVLYDRLPRLAPGFASLGLYRWEVTIRETVVVGLVAAGGLGFVLNNELASFDYQSVTGTLIALVLITALVDLASTRIRRSLR